MRTEVLTSLLVLGLVTSITPLGVLGIFAVTGAKRSNGIAFVVGWSLALSTFAVLGGTVLHGSVEAETTPSKWLNGAVAVVGLLMVAGAFVLRGRSRRPKPEPAEPKGPGLNERLGGLGTRGAIVAGFAMAPYPMGFEAGVLLIQTESGPGTRLLAMVLFAAISTWPMIAIVAVIYRGGDRVQQRLRDLHSWVEGHRVDIGFWLLLALGLMIAVPALHTALGKG